MNFRPHAFPVHVEFIPSLRKQRLLKEIDGFRPQRCDDLAFCPLTWGRVPTFRMLGVVGVRAVCCLLRHEEPDQELSPGREMVPEPFKRLKRMLPVADHLERSVRDVDRSVSVRNVTVLHPLVIESGLQPTAFSRLYGESQAISRHVRAVDLESKLKQRKKMASRTTGLIERKPPVRSDSALIERQFLGWDTVCRAGIQQLRGKAVPSFAQIVDIFIHHAIPNDACFTPPIGRSHVAMRSEG